MTTSHAPVVAGETILEFVRRIRGREVIPTLCQADNLENYGSCRICSVEVALKEDGPGKGDGIMPYAGGTGILYLPLHRKDQEAETEHPRACSLRISA
ncbi:MAG: 2Fe-2S iron-sulfur cluster-binding protein [Marinilabiliales bacterium]|nr:2Fe-2S iron-sulfur cluster-binding protein [Marinilabiliales bacterium]